jgi:hypothetical protein
MQTEGDKVQGEIKFIPKALEKCSLTVYGSGQKDGEATFSPSHCSHLAT